MFEGLFGPLHLLILLLSATVVFGLPILVIFFLVQFLDKRARRNQSPSPPDSLNSDHHERLH